MRLACLFGRHELDATCKCKHCSAIKHDWKEVEQVLVSTPDKDYDSAVTEANTKKRYLVKYQCRRCCATSQYEISESTTH